MARRILAAFVHVIGEDGYPAVLAPGSKLPKWAASQVTNPAAFAPAGSSDDDDDEGAPPATTPAVTPPVTPSVTPEDEQAAAEKAAAEKAAADQAAAEKEAADQAAAEKAAAAAEGAERQEEPQGDLAYADRSYRSLQAAAKLRGLSAAGNEGALIARLEADDRDRAEQ